MGTIQVQFTIDDETAGEVIATELLRRHLVACVQTLGPMTSRYRWQGSINRAREWLFVCKTTTARFDEVVECIRDLHPYDVPEIVACDVTGGLRDYLAWVAAETQSPSSAT